MEYRDCGPKDGDEIVIMNALPGMIESGERVLCEMYKKQFGEYPKGYEPKRIE